MSIFKKRTNFPEAAEVLATEGFTDNYISVLSASVEKAEHPQDITRGKSYLANALLKKST